jgi:outer membrane receptor protein involved in Fe transport
VLHFSNPAANTEASVTIQAVNDGEVKIRGIDVGYTADPTGGSVIVESPTGTVIWSMPLTKAGPGQFEFYPLEGEHQKDVKVRLTAGGASVVGSLAVHTE